jgi:hypothetical protein
MTRPGVPLPLPLPPKEENQQPPQKRLPINLAHHQCAAAGIDPIGSPHPRIQCIGPLQNLDLIETLIMGKIILNRILIRKCECRCNSVMREKLDIQSTSCLLLI